jgi:hypothetical protein
VRDNCQHSKHETKAMKEGWGAAKDVEGSEAHAVANESRIVHQVAVKKGARVSSELGYRC